MKYKIIGGLLILIGVTIVIGVSFHNSRKKQQAVVFSPNQMLNALWQNYKANYWESSTGRTLDKQRGGITTSEGQSYALLRSVWLDDKPTFDKSWEWMQSNLKRSDSNLFSWLYGKKSDGSYGILTDQGGQNTASDADEDTAMALVFAAARWEDPAYLEKAKPIINDIWNQEVVTVNGKPYLVADNIEKNSPSQVLINPSYCAPYAYRIFAQVDLTHPWSRLVDTCYEMINTSASLNLDKPGTAGLPPDWVSLDRKTGVLATPTQSRNLTTNYSFDAMRIPWRISLDWQWNKDSRAKSTLDKFSFLNQQWQDIHALYPSYSHDGSILIETESPAMYGSSMGYFLAEDQKYADAIYNSKLKSLYNPDKPGWKNDTSYYDDNWAWFGLALYHNFTVNLVQSSAQTVNNQN